MDIGKFFEEYDVIARTKTDEELEAWLQKACFDYTVSSPNDRYGRAALYNELGAFYRERNRLAEGEHAFLKAKEMLETPVMHTKINCIHCALDYYEDLKESADYATTLNNLAGLYRMWGKPEKALGLFEEACAVYGRIPNSPVHAVASCHNNKGLVYLDLGKGAEAEVCFRDALTLIEGLESNDWFYGTTLSNLAFAYVSSGNIPAACDTLRKAAERFRLSGEENREIAQNCLAMAEKLEQQQ